MRLRTRLLLLVLLSAIPAFLLAIYTNLLLRKAGAARVENDAMKMVQLVGASQNGLIEATRQHLAGLARFPQARGNDLPAFTTFFAQMRKVYRNYADFGLIETNGDLVACSFGGISPTNLSDRPHLQRVLKSRELSIGEYQAGDATNNASLPFGYPVLDEKGGLARVLYAALDLAVLNKSLAVSELPEGGVVQIFDRSGRVLGRYPEPEKWVGKTEMELGVFKTILEKEAGSVEITSADGVPRLYVFSSIRNGSDANLFVTVGIPTVLAYAEPNRLLMLNLIVLGVVAGGALMLASLYASRYVLLPLKTLSNAAKRVAAGDLTARTGIPAGAGELQQLARTFDEMAESLQQQNQKINELNANLERRVADRTAQLEASNKELEAFSYSVSHDLRAPARHVHNFAEMLRREPDSVLGENGRRLLGVVLQAGDRMGKLIDDLLAFSRTGRAELRRKPVLMDAIVQEVLEEVKRDRETEKIQWEIETLPEVFADGAMMKQVWANLISNAVKYTRLTENPQIKIGCRPEAEEFGFYVRDNGAGFDMQYADKLFGVFQRLHPETEFEGTGIGLANVRRIVSRHGGRTWAEGKVGQGATFYFTLPRPGSD